MWRLMFGRFALLSHQSPTLTCATKRKARPPTMRRSSRRRSSAGRVPAPAAVTDSVFSNADLLGLIVRHCCLDLRYVARGTRDKAGRPRNYQPSFYCDALGNFRGLDEWSEAVPEHVELVGGSRHAAVCCTAKAWANAMLTAAAPRCQSRWPALALDKNARSDLEFYHLLCWRARAELAFGDPVPRAPKRNTSLSDYSISLAILGSSCCLHHGTPIFKGTMRLDAAVPAGQRITRHSHFSEGYFEMDNELTAAAFLAQDVEPMCLGVALIDGPHDHDEVPDSPTERDKFCALHADYMGLSTASVSLFVERVDGAKACLAIGPGRDEKTGKTHTRGWEFGEIGDKLGSTTRLAPGQTPSVLGPLNGEVDVHFEVIDGLGPDHPLWNEEHMRAVVDTFEDYEDDGTWDGEVRPGYCAHGYALPEGAKPAGRKGCHWCALYAYSAALRFDLPQAEGAEQQEDEGEEMPSDMQVLHALEHLPWTR